MTGNKHSGTVLIKFWYLDILVVNFLYAGKVKKNRKLQSDNYSFKRMQLKKVQ